MVLKLNSPGKHDAQEADAKAPGLGFAVPEGHATAMAFTLVDEAFAGTLPGHQKPQGQSCAYAQ